MNIRYMTRKQLLRHVLLLCTFCLAILPSCKPSERTKDAATETVRQTPNAVPFTREIYDKLLVADAHGEAAIPVQIYTVTVTITTVSASREKNATDISLTGKLWPSSKVEGKFVFSQSEFEQVAAQKPGDVVALKAKLNSISSSQVHFIGTIFSAKQATTPRTNG